MNRSEAEAHLDALWQRGREFLGSRYAIMGGAMTWVSERNLVAAISNGGGFGVIASGSMSPDVLEVEIAATAALTDKPFGVNLIIMHPELEQLVDACVAQGVGHIVLAGGLPASSIIRRIKDAGGKVICFVPSVMVGRKLVRTGADPRVIAGFEAGAHIGPAATSGR